MKEARSELKYVYMKVLGLGCLSPEIKSWVNADYGEILFCLTSCNYKVKIYYSKM